MDSIYETSFKVEPWQVDRFQRLKTSELAKLFQIAAIEHTEELGAGREHTFDKNLLWIISRIKGRVKRPLMYGEKVTFRSWPLDTMHIIFPRCYSIEDASGEEIVRASSLWLLIDREKREMVFPDEYGIIIPSDNGMERYSLPSDLAGFHQDQSKQIKIEYSDLDLNGHVNNTQYFQWVDNIHNEDWHRHHFFSDFQMNFKKELSADDTAQIVSKEEENKLMVAGKNDEGEIFTFKGVFELI